MFDGAHGIDLPKPHVASTPAAPSHAHLDGEICDGGHRMLVRVYYEDTDFSGIVYHANYLRFLERGRSNYLRLLGADQRALFSDGVGEAPGYAFVVRAMQLEFLRSARMDDLLEVETRPLEVKGASITMGQRILRDGTVLFEAKVKVAFVSGGRPRPIPKAIRTAMSADGAGPDFASSNVMASKSISGDEPC
ncbi:4-hydroxybenzoyl-CoA thioesterase [Rhodopseudomonas palustris BisB18]|uniref:4-hydroxybenzoyl-CoA thioesterase n=2 Tax=Rhodopseudomonas palustris TaxID=1076 RepID=Q217F5_RHOPB